MLNYKKLLTILVVLYCTVFLLTVFFSDPTDTAQNFVESNVAAFLQFEEELAKEAAPFKAPKLTFKTNPFPRLGAYPDPIDYIDKPLYDVSQYSLYNDDDYCDQVDLYNLENPENMFENMNFFTDVKQENMLRHKVLGRIGKLHQSHLDKSMSKEKSRTRTDHLDKEINAFIISTYQFQRHYQIGKHFLCATQISNHIPNQTTLIKKGQVMQSIEDYALKYKDQPECFNKFAFSPKTYRLFVEEECKEFFNIINSEEYLDSLTAEPIQYVIKTGRDAHKGQGVDILNTTVADKINKKYDSGKKCGEDTDFDVAQKYIANPLLLDKNNKFHMRVYMLIASSNPLIVYYQDGYIRAMITPYDKLSENKESHLTNLMVDDLNQAIKENRTINGMTPQELDEYQIWRLEELQDYLLETGQIQDTTWLDTHLRPTLQRAFVHLARMAGRYLWKQSNVYELLGCDFMMDDQLGVWFLEANSFPQVDGVKDDLITRMLEDLFEIEFGYYRSRMKRVIAVLQKMQEEAGDKPKKAELGTWKELYQEAMKNRFEPEFAIKETNSFKKIVDDSLPGDEAYFGLLSEECAQI